MTYKQHLYNYCQSLVQQKINETEAALQAARTAAHEETKSSAGDKYETGRAMMHLEQEKLVGRRTEAGRLKKVLDQIDPARSPARVALGSLVETNIGWFFVAVGLGNVALEQQACFVISPAAPIGQALMDKSAGEELMFNGRTVHIVRVT